jgi:hypothetical protein
MQRQQEEDERDDRALDHVGRRVPRQRSEARDLEARDFEGGRHGAKCAL